MSEQLVAWTVSIGRAGTGGLNDAKHGCILQKAVERPHLLDRARLVQHWPGGFPRTEDQPMAEESKPVQREMHKWNWRVWVLGSMGSESGPSAWLYNESYADLCGLPFTTKLLASAHVSNLQPPGRSFAKFTRSWDLRAVGQYFLHSREKAAGPEADDIAAVLMPQVRCCCFPVDADSSERKRLLTNNSSDICIAKRLLTETGSWERQHAYT